MPQLSQTPQNEPGASERSGVLLVNLGTPDAPTAKAVRNYLAEFLSDPRVIDYPRWLWLPILYGVILQVRPRKSAHAYAQIWTAEGSPLLVHTLALAEKLRQSLSTALGNDARLAVGMTYGSPSIASALAELHAAKLDRLIVLPLYPQYSRATTASVADSVARSLRHLNWSPELRFITQYHDDSNYIEALAQSLEAHWRQHPRRHLLMSFHGLPKRYTQAGDPYHRQCLETARLLVERLQLASGGWTVSFQSRVGRAEWLRPYTDESLRALAREQKGVTAFCPGFAVDCLETLEEIAIRNRADFLAAGGEHFEYVPALNASDAHAKLLSRLILEYARAPAVASAQALSSQTRMRSVKS